MEGFMRTIGLLVIGLLTAAPAYAQPPDWARNSAPGAAMSNLPQPGYYPGREYEGRRYQDERALERERAAAHDRSFEHERNLEHQRGVQDQRQSLRSQQVAATPPGNGMGKSSAAGAPPNRLRAGAAAAPAATPAPPTGSRAVASKCAGSGRCGK